MRSPTSGPSANCSKLLVADSTNIIDHNRCFLKDVLVSKQKISCLPEFNVNYSHTVVFTFHLHIRLSQETKSNKYSRIEVFLQRDFRLKDLTKGHSKSTFVEEGGGGSAGR